MDAVDLLAWLRLSLTPGIGNTTARRLLSAFGLPQNLFAQHQAALKSLVTQTQAHALSREPENLPAQFERTQQWLRESQNGVQRRILTLADSDYPAGLLNMPDPPLMLYLQGQLQTLQLQGWPQQALAVVGSRTPTPQGLLNARQFARAMVHAKLCIVSGLALGIDGAAHDGALLAAEKDACPLPLPTVAVLGTGLDRIYPARHRALAQRVMAHGLMMSEFPLGTAPLPANFPKRNRLIAGLSQGTLVVEAALRSGSLVTARLALEQGKEVFAIPGSIHSPLSRGPHALIRQGAKLVETARDILEEMQLDAPVAAADGQTLQTPSASAMTDSEDMLLQALGDDPSSLDALQARTGLATAQLQARLLELELQGQVARLPGNLFQRLHRA